MPSTSRIILCASLGSPNLRRIKFDRRAFTTPDANSRSLTPLIHFDLQSLSGGVRDDSVRVECRGSAWKKTLALTKMHRHGEDSTRKPKNPRLLISVGAPAIPRSRRFADPLRSNAEAFERP